VIWCPIIVAYSIIDFYTVIVSPAVGYYSKQFKLNEHAKFYLIELIYLNDKDPRLTGDIYGPGYPRATILEATTAIRRLVL
jgi:hypothetical protein